MTFMYLVVCVDGYLVKLRRTWRQCDATHSTVRARSFYAERVQALISATGSISTRVWTLLIVHVYLQLYATLV
jgi:hypothetical protein